MISIDLQIKSLIFSFVFGILFALIFDVNQKLIYEKNNWYRWLVSFSLVFIFTMGYFLILKYLNGGVLHLYFIFMIVLGILVYNKFFHKYFKF
jgi:hypothetical protein